MLYRARLGTKAMRTSDPVCYDITDEKRLRKVFKTMRSYGDHCCKEQSTVDSRRSKVKAPAFLASDL